MYVLARIILHLSADSSKVASCSQFPASVSCLCGSTCISGQADVNYTREADIMPPTIHTALWAYCVNGTNDLKH